MRGLPGSGKSTTARNLAATLGPRTAVVAKDAIRKMLFPNTYYKDCDLYQIQDIRDGILRGLKNSGDYDNIIIDETFIEFEDISNAVSLFTRWDAFYFVDHTSVDWTTCLLRQNDRSHLDRVSEDAMKHFDEMLDLDNMLFKEHVEPWVTLIDYKDTYKEDFRALFTRTDRDESVSVPQGTRISHS